MDIKRKLATIQTVSEIGSIENADRICKVNFKSVQWSCVMKKEEARIGSKVIYIEVDSVVPDIDIFEFLSKNKFRVKTMKFKGQISQGLAIPVKSVKDTQFFKDHNIVIDENLDDGTDLTDLLGIKVYKIPEEFKISGDQKGVFPSHLIEKTDEPRLQNFNDEEIGKFLSMELQATIKLDGCSGTFFIYEGNYGVCSRNFEMKDTEKNVFWEISRKYKIKEKLEKWFKEKGEGGIAIQGEIIGPKIQKNRGKIPEIELRVFTVQSLHPKTLMDRIDLDSFLESINEGEEMKLESVPVIGTFAPNHFSSFDNILDFVRSKELNKFLSIEGVVFRSTKNLKTSFKVINPDYLIKNRL